MIRRVLKKCLLYGYLVKSINFVKFAKLYDKESDKVLLLTATNRSDYREYFFGNGIIKDVALIKAFISQGISFRILTSGKKLYPLSGKQVFFNLSKFFTFHSGINYSDSLLNFQKQLLANGNTIYPRHQDAEYWENKIFMHRRFKELDISHPETVIVDEANKAPEKLPFSFPILFKPAHSSGSMGIEKVDSIENYRQLVKSTKYKEYLLQEWIDMRRDLRLIYVGNDLVLHYWRINNADTWRPTSTSTGSSVDFETLPEKWMDFIFQEYKKLDISVGAFDITWRHDDLDTKPLILEVSTSYMPNPPPVGRYVDLPYNEYKKGLFGSDAYYKQYLKLVFRLTDKEIENYHNGN